MSLRMGLATTGFEPGEDESAFRARILASLFRFVLDSPLEVQSVLNLKESHNYENGFWIHIPFITCPVLSQSGVWGVPNLSTLDLEGAQPHAHLFVVQSRDSLLLIDL